MRAYQSQNEIACDDQIALELCHWHELPIEGRASHGACGTGPSGSLTRAVVRMSGFFWIARGQAQILDA